MALLLAIVMTMGLWAVPAFAGEDGDLDAPQEGIEQQVPAVTPTPIPEETPGGSEVAPTVEPTPSAPEDKEPGENEEDGMELIPLQPGPTEPVDEMAKIYVSADGVDEAGNGTEEAPYATLAYAVGQAPAEATIYVMSDLVMDKMAWIMGKDITIASYPEDAQWTISRGEMATSSDTGRSWYNPAMIEVNGSLYLEDIILDDGGEHEGTYYLQQGTGSDHTVTFTSDYRDSKGNRPNPPVPAYEATYGNKELVQDAMIASYDGKGKIVLGAGAVLKNYGGMSAVRITGAGGELIMLEGSRICNDPEVNEMWQGAADPVPYKEGSKYVARTDYGAAGAVWLQGGSFTMEAGAQIADLNGRAVYADNGRVDIKGEICGLEYNANLWNAAQGVAVHLRGGATGEISGEIYGIDLTGLASASALHVVDKGDIVLSGEIHHVTGGYVLNLICASTGTLTGDIHDISGKVIRLVDESGEPYIGDTDHTVFKMESGATIYGVTNGGVIEAVVNRGSLTAPDGDRDIPYENCDHVSFTIDGEIYGVEGSGVSMISINTGVNSFGPYAKVPGQYIDCTIGENAKIHNNKVTHVIHTLGSTVDIFGEIYENEGCVYSGNHNGADALVTLHDGASIHDNQVVKDAWGSNSTFVLSNAKVVMEEGSSIYKNSSVGTASVAYISKGGQFIMEGGEVYGNSTSSEEGGLISYISGTSWTQMVASVVQLNGGKVYDNTSAGGYDIIIGGNSDEGDKQPSYAGYAGTATPDGDVYDCERCVTIPGGEVMKDVTVHYQKATHTKKIDKVSHSYIDYYGMELTAASGTKLGVIHKTPAEEATNGLTRLTEAASSYGCSAPFTAFWVQNDEGTPITIKMDAADGVPSETMHVPDKPFDPAKPVYVLCWQTEGMGLLSESAQPTFYAATVAADGTITFDIAPEKTGAAGCAIALVQPDIIDGALELTTTVKEIKAGQESYTIPYTVKFDLAKGGITAESIQSAVVTFYSTDPNWNGKSVDLDKASLAGTWDMVLPKVDFQPGKTLTTSAKITIQTTAGEKTFYSNGVDIKMIGLETYVIKATADTHGKITPAGSISVTEGNDQSFTITPNSGYRIDDVLVDGRSVGARSSYEFENVDRDHTIHASFYKKSSGGGGGGGGGGSTEVPEEPVPLDPLPELVKGDHFAYIVGRDDGMVHPEAQITRGEVATIFFRLLTEESRDYYWNTVSPFPDVAEDAWYKTAVATLSRAEIVHGRSDGTFAPDAAITRAEFASIATRFFGGTYEGKDLFSDIQGHWAQDAINLAADRGIVNGYVDGTFRPDQPISRAEAIAMINRTLDRRPHADHLLDDMIVWKDNMDEDAWYYLDIQEATNSHDFKPSKSEKGEAQYEIWTELLPNPDWSALYRNR